MFKQEGRHRREMAALSNINLINPVQVLFKTYFLLMLCFKNHSF